MPRTLTGKVAVAAGASRGCGRGIALALGEAGAIVYVTARTTRAGPKPADSAPGTIEDVVEEVNERGGRAISLPVDYTDPEQVEALFGRVHRDYGQLDIVACAVWGGNERYLDPSWKRPFWEHPTQTWTEHLDAGPRAFWHAACSASRIMARRRSGLIAVVTEPILANAFEGQQTSTQDTFSHLAHHGINRLVAHLGREAADNGITIVGLLPGFMRTERVEMHLDSLGEGAREQFRYDLAESTEYAGRAVAALASDPNVLSKAGNLFYVADLAEEYGFTDVDGKRVQNFYRVLGLVK